MDTSAFSSSAVDPFSSWGGIARCNEPVPVAFPNGMLPPLIDMRSKRDASLWSRSKKFRACSRIGALPVWAGCRQVLRLLVERGKGDRHRCVFSHGHIRELLHRSGKIRGEGGTLYTVQYIRVCLRKLEDHGLVRWTRLLPGDCFPSRDMQVDGAGEEVKFGACVFEVNMAALLGEGPVWTPRRRYPGAGGRPRLEAVDQVAQAEELGEALREFRELGATAAAEPPIEASPEAPPASGGVIIHDLERVIIHDHCSLPASQDLNPAPERSGAAGPQRPPAVHEASETPPSASALPPGSAGPPARPPEQVASETPPDANGSQASHDAGRGADAPRAPTGKEQRPGPRDDDDPREHAARAMAEIWAQPWAGKAGGK